jgi:DNA-binding MarR family transcriptional regulator
MRLEMSPAAVTTVIDRLEDAGHVSRSPDPGDRRSVMVAPMQASVHRAMVRIGPMVGDVDAVLDDFPPEEQAAIQRYLGLVVERYENHLAPTD